MIVSAPQTLVPVEPPTLRPVTRAHEAHRRDRRGVRHLDHPVDDVREERRLDPRAPDALDARRPAGERRRVARPARVEDRVLRVDDAQAGGVAAEAHVAADRRARPAGAGADHDPRGHRVRLQRHLREDRLGDVVVAAPVRRALGVGELVEVVPAARRPRAAGPRRTIVRGSSTKWQRPPWASISAIFSGLVDAGITATNGRPEQAGEVRLGDGRRAAGGLDDRRPLGDPAVAEAVEEQRAREPVLERSRRVDRLVLQVEVDPPLRRQREDVQVRVGGAVGVGLDAPDRLVGPLARAQVPTIVRGRRHTRGPFAPTARRPKATPSPGGVADQPRPRPGSTSDDLEGLLRVDHPRGSRRSRTGRSVAWAMYMFIRTWCWPGTISAGPPGPSAMPRVVERRDDVRLVERARLPHRGLPELQAAVQARARAAGGEHGRAGKALVVAAEQLLAERVADVLVVVEAAVEALDVLGRHEVEEVLVEVGADDRPAPLGEAGVVELLEERREARAARSC